MKMRELLVLQVIGILLFVGLSLLLWLWGIFNIATAMIIYLMVAVGNVLNVHTQLIKPIEEIGTYDKLTRCYNRTKLNIKVKEYDNYTTYAIIFFDVNNLKKMNDIHGHEDGDKLLRNAAIQLMFWRRYGDVYRIGGDEFIVVVPNAKKEQIEKTLKRWYDSLPVLNAGYNDDFVCNFSYGIFYKEDNVSFEEIMKKADEEMYKMKKKLKAQRN